DRAATPGVQLPHRQLRCGADPGHQLNTSTPGEHLHRQCQVVFAGGVEVYVHPGRRRRSQLPAQLGITVVEHRVSAEPATELPVGGPRAREYTCPGPCGEHDRGTTDVPGTTGDIHGLARL